MGVEQSAPTARSREDIFMSILRAGTGEGYGEFDNTTFLGNRFFADEPHLIIGVSASRIIDQRGGIEDYGGQIALGLG